MNKTEEFDSRIDLHSLTLLRKVAEHRGVTSAARELGISQSALSRQIKSIEERLGVMVFERTTRRLSLTEPGAILLRETAVIPSILDGALRRIREEYLNVPSEVCVGISRDLSLAHMPGIFHAQQRSQPEVKILVTQPDGDQLLEELISGKIDVGIVTRTKTLSSDVVVTHRMEDVFSILVPMATELYQGGIQKFRRWTESQTWLLPPAGSPTRVMIDQWAETHKVDFQVAMELESFDLMAHFVALNMGSALIPRRGLSGFPRKNLVRKLELPKPLSRELIVILAKQMKPTDHVRRFVEGILFS